MLIPLRIRPLLAVLAPPLCWSCHGAAHVHEPLCRGCRVRLRFLGPEVVPLGGLPLWAAVAYDGPARDLVRGLKYRGAAGLAQALAAQIAANVPADLVAVQGPADRAARGTAQFRLVAAQGPADRAAGGTPQRRSGRQALPAEAVPAPAGLVPVPGARSRVRRRGYDQAGLIAAALADRTGLPLVPCLERRDGAVSQVGRGRAARRAALADAIGVRSAPPLAAIVVDDVVTTGATVAACATALRAAGCERVVALAYARTPGR